MNQLIQPFLWKSAKLSMKLVQILLQKLILQKLILKNFTHVYQKY